MHESKEDRAARLNRERVARHKKKAQEEKGLVKLSVWVRRECVDKLKNFAKTLR